MCTNVEEVIQALDDRFLRYDVSVHPVGNDEALIQITDLTADPLSVRRLSDQVCCPLPVAFRTASLIHQWSRNGVWPVAEFPDVPVELLENSLVVPTADIVGLLSNLTASMGR